MTVIRSSSGRAFRLVADTRGATAAVMAVAMATIVGFAGLGVETGLWFSQKRHYQTAADAAAISGAFALANGASLGATCSSATTTIWGVGCKNAINNGYTATGSNTITITQGNWSGSSYTSGGTPVNAVRAVITEPKTTMLADVVGVSSVTIGVSAVAIVTTMPGNPCFLALQTTTASNSGSGPNGSAITISGNTTVDMEHCWIASNAPGADSITQAGSSTVTAGDLWAVGGVNTNGGAFNFTATDSPGVPITNQGTSAAITDPLSGLSSTPPAGTPSQTVPNAVNGTVSMQPGIYDPPTGNTISLNATGVSYQLAPGTYYIHDASLIIGSPISVGPVPAGATNTGVTFVLYGSPASKIGNVTINSGASGTLTPSTSGTYTGVLFFQDPAANGSSQQSSITASSNLSLSGDLYFPGNTVNFSGNTNAGAPVSTCLQVISWRINITGDSVLSNSGCSNSIPTPKIYRVALAQ